MLIVSDRVMLFLMTTVLPSNKAAMSAVSVVTLTVVARRATRATVMSSSALKWCLLRMASVGVAMMARTEGKVYAVQMRKGIFADLVSLGQNTTRPNRTAEPTIESTAEPVADPKADLAVAEIP